MRSTAARLARCAAVAIVALLVVVTAVAPQAAAQTADDRTTTFGFALQADGDARVSVTLRIPLADESDREAFDRLAEEHRGGDGSPLSVSPFERAAERASESTGRPMAIRDVIRTAGQSNDTGRLALAFTWTNFTDVAGDRLLIGDAFRTPEGTWFPGLEERQTLVISPPPGYSAQSVTMSGERYQLVNGTVRVQGPATFEPGTPSLVLRQTNGVSETPDGGGLPTGFARFAGIVGIAVVLVLLAFLVYLFGDRPAVLVRSSVEEEEAAEASAAAEEADPMAQSLLSDEERVLRLLEIRDGRMKQVEIVEATDWSNAKVSQLLSEMEEEGRIDKLRIGRENLISLPGEGPGSG